MKRTARWLCVAMVLSLVLVGTWKIVNSRTFQFFGNPIASVACAGKYVALTLDDGPTPEGTDALLALLAEQQARATFFVEGRTLSAHPEAGRRIVRAGHELGNHSYSHQRMIFRSQAFIRGELEATDAAIAAAGQAGEILFRPPFGKKLFGLPWYLERTGRKSVMWNIEPESMPGVEQTDAGLAAHVLEVVTPGSIILMHAMHDPSGVKLEALRRMLAGLRTRGYEVVGVSELVRACAATGAVRATPGTARARAAARAAARVAAARARG